MKVEEYIEPVFDFVAEHGEGPLWDEEKQQFYWVDLLKGTYQVGDLKDKSVQQFKVGQELGVMALRENGGNVMALRDGFGFYNQTTETLDLINPTSELLNPNIRFNDGIVAPGGYFFAGTMQWEGKENIGKLYRLNLDHSYDIIDENLWIPNGMGWNTLEDTFYMVDTSQHCIFAYDYDISNGHISNKRVHIQFADSDFPDGMTIDANGYFWIAMWGGSRIEVYNPYGKKKMDIELPVPYPTSCCFGGEHLDKLFVTTSKLIMKEDELKKYPLSGKSFIIDTDSKGKIDYRFLA